MRILKGLSSRLLSCGCIAGVYETYEGDVVTIIDAPGPSCSDRTHTDGNTIPSLSDTRTSKGTIAARD